MGVYCVSDFMGGRTNQGWETQGEHDQVETATGIVTACWKRDCSGGLELFLEFWDGDKSEWGCKSRGMM